MSTPCYYCDLERGIDCKLCIHKVDVAELIQQAHRDATEEVTKAHKRGWEQAKREADSLLLDLIDVVLESKPVVQSARRAIANMPYKEPRDD